MIAARLRPRRRSSKGEAVGQHPQYVFTYQGHRVSQINTKAWRKAVKQAGLEDFRWHDLRHTWASWHAQAGTPINVLQEMGGLGECRDGAALRALGGRAPARARQAHCTKSAPVADREAEEFV